MVVNRQQVLFVAKVRNKACFLLPCKSKTVSWTVLNCLPEGGNMPQNKRESFIFTIMMCFFMVFVMSIYNVSLHMGQLSIDTIKAAWLGFPIAYCVAMCCDWFFVSSIAKGFAFRFLVTPESNALKKAIAVSCCMVIPMVIIMSLYGALEVTLQTGSWDLIPIIWLTNIPKNFIMALPLQLLIAGPLVRALFRKVFPEGTILA